jgi:VanZ family protein
MPAMSDSPTKRTARWMLGFILFLMLYGSLQPFHLRHVDFDSPLDLLLRLRWGISPPGDMFVNVVLYMPFGVALAWVLPERWSAAARLLAASLCGFLLSLAVEVAQWFIVTRVASLADVTMDTAGSLLGCATGLGLRACGERLARSERIGVTRDPVAAGLLVAWLGSFLPSFVPRFAPAHWPAEWSARLAAGWPGWPPIAMQALGWLIAGALLSVLTRPALVWRVLAILAALTLAVRFTWFAHSAGNAEFVGALGALALWPLAARLPPVWLHRLAAALLLAGLVYRGLAPFRFAPLRHDLHWMPFTDLVSHTSTGFNLPLLCGKAFTYGTLVWLVVAAGGRAWRTGLATAAILLAIEVLQLGTPPGEHFSTLTDPAIALCAGFVLMLLPPSGSTGARPREPRRAAA